MARKPKQFDIQNFVNTLNEAELNNYQDINALDSVNQIKKVFDSFKEQIEEIEKNKQTLLIHFDNLKKVIIEELNKDLS